MPVSELAELLLAGFAAYRLARFVAIDEGPGGVFQSLRVHLGAYDYGADGRAATGLGRGISCIHCVGFWMAGVTLVLMRFHLVDPLIEILAVAGIVSAIGSTGSPTGSLHGRT